jgi:hypothetical protein
VKGGEKKQTTQTNGFLSDDTKLVNLKKTKKPKQTQQQQKILIPIPKTKTRGGKKRKKNRAENRTRKEDCKRWMSAG